MNKLANPNYMELRDQTPIELGLLSLLTGAGGFGATRFLTDSLHKLSPPKDPGNTVDLALRNPDHKRDEHMVHPQHEQTIPQYGASSPQSGSDPALDSSVPSSVGMPKTAGGYMPDAALGHPESSSPAPSASPSFGAPEATGGMEPWAQKALAVALGVPAGFLGAKKLYDTYQQHSLGAQVERAKKQYDEQLRLAQAGQGQGKMASTTPLTDKFCEGLAKEANLIGLDKLGNETASPATIDALTPKWQADATANGLNGLSHMADGATGHPGSALADAFKLLVMGGALGTGGWLINKSMNSREKEMKSKYPTAVSYAE